MDTTSESFFIIFILIVCAGLFLLIWLIMLFLVSRFGGWNKLYQKYKFPSNAQKPYITKSFQSIQIGISNYNGVIKLAYHPEGLALEVMIFFRFAHPKILIPWRNIKLKEKSKSEFFGNKLEIGNPTIVTISVNNKILEEINAYITQRENSSDEIWR